MSSGSVSAREGKSEEGIAPGFYEMERRVVLARESG
jgi:hypothetical protein